ncbi:MAG: hypothetical protein JWO86_6762 [Myxococcaceae bacterium]|nr:hypothetical protein [Myxococcaceae bacterium]MEA2750016.1 hypothetical protein [Myxococcales bacterium]
MTDGERLPATRADERALEGNGAGLVREIALASRIQRGLEALYRLDRAADVDAFVTHAGDGQREALLVRESEDGLELQLRIPRLGDRAVDVEGAGLDPLCQIIEGVSHFVYLADRASLGREATQLELELQAEVDKYVILASALGNGAGFDERSSRRLRERLYDNVSFVHAKDTVEGERYRMANGCARRFTGRLERDYVTRARFSELQGELRRFFHMGQGEKLRAA